MKNPSGREILETIEAASSISAEVASAMITAIAKSPEQFDKIVGYLRETEAGRHLVIAAAVQFAIPSAVPEKGPKRPLPDTGPGPGDQPGKIDRENHARIVGYLRTNGPTGPAAVKAALNLKEGEWIRALTGDPKIVATGKGAGRKYAVEGK